MNRKIGAGLLALGFLLGSFVSVREIDHVRWTSAYLPCVAAMLVGMVLLRRGSAAGGEEVEARRSEDLGSLRTSLQTVNQRLDALLGEFEQLNVYDVHDRLDDELADPLQRFANAREAMIPKVGLAGYAEVMSSFATGERLINRSWCASADGYVDEVRSCLGDAQREMHRAEQLLVEHGI